MLKYKVSFWKIILPLCILILSLHLSTCRKKKPHRRKDVQLQVSEKESDKKSAKKRPTEMLYNDDGCLYDLSWHNDTEKKGEITFNKFMSNVRKTIMAFAKENKVKLRSYDIDGEYVRELIAKDPSQREELSRFLKHKLTSTSGSTHYGQATKCKKGFGKPTENAYSVCNPDAKKRKKFAPPQEVIHFESKMVWEMRKGLDINGKKIGVKAKPPNEVLSDHSGNSKNISEGLKPETVVDVREALIISHNFTVEPKTKLNVDYIIRKIDVELPFVSELILDGWILAAFDKEVPGKDSKLVPFPIADFANEHFELRGKSLVFNASGVFRGAKGVTLETYYEEEPFKSKQGCKYVV